MALILLNNTRLQRTTTSRRLTHERTPALNLYGQVLMTLEESATSALVSCGMKFVYTKSHV